MSLPLVFQAGVRDEIDEAYGWYESQRKGLAVARSTRSRAAQGCGGPNLGDGDPGEPVVRLSGAMIDGEPPD